MRISDWSSDVCSSDLSGANLSRAKSARRRWRLPGQLRRLDGGGRLSDRAGTRLCAVARTVRGALARTARREASAERPAGAARLCQAPDRGPSRHRQFGLRGEIGRASCRERGCHDVLDTEVALSLKKTNIKKLQHNNKNKH